MGKALVVVESPAKARTIGRYLGKDMTVLASMGHVRDLPSSSLGVNLNKDFQPEYVTTGNGKKVISELRKAAKSADDIYLATDPDREGEAIAWHLQELLKSVSKAEFHRVSFHEITPRAISASFEHPGAIADKLVDAQQARRVLDRLVGYQVSPMLWREIQRGTSAGRVQSVALRIVVEREREILNFEPVEYWNMDALFETQDPKTQLQTRLALLDGKKANIPNEAVAIALAEELESAAFRVAKVESKPRRQSAPPPFITSTLQQAAGGGLRMSTSQTMRIAQQLYEGVELGAGGPVGLITYMRTDSFNISQEAKTQAREFIGEKFGAEYIPKKPNNYTSRKSAQEAHEAIRPTDVTRTPDEMAKFLDSRQLQLYRLIWSRFLASQMTAAKQLDHVIEIEALANPKPLEHSYAFRATARETVFPGYLVVYKDIKLDAEGEEEQGNRLPPLKAGLPCLLLELGKEQCFTTPPRRYSEATLVRALEQNGVGRPSTYATTVGTIQTRKYVEKEKSRLVPTELGFKVNDYLVERMPQLFDIGFTAEMEERLDKIEEGEIQWTGMLKEFYDQFKNWIDIRDAISVPAESATALRFLDVFPDNIEWAPPVKRGRRTYDDQKFVNSIREQITVKKKVLSERQWKALLTLAVRYADQLPQLEEISAELDLVETVSALQLTFKAEEEAKASEPTEPDAADLELLTAMNGVSNWEEPTTRGKRTYDDQKFINSLREQVEGGSRLSPAQKNALKRIVSKYAAQLANYDALVKAHQLAAPDEGMSEDEQVAISAMLALFDSVTKWAEPVKRGKRTYDDSEFVESLKGQFERKKALSSRQVAALKKMIPKYAEQIPDYKSKAEALGLGEAAAPPKKLDAKCPECGAPLIQRTGRRGVFYGCSAYPKCKFISNELPEPQ